MCWEEISNPEASGFRPTAQIGTDGKLKVSHIQVEYDKKFFGGDYSLVGDFALVRLSDVYRLGSVEAAFKHTTGIEAVHIIHYSEDELYDADWNPIDS